jgi:chemotaxis protein methyltransferase CheR
MLLKIRGKDYGADTVANIPSRHNLIDSLVISDDALAEISLILEMRLNFSMSIYKDKCMKRRIAIRMRSCNCLDAAGYCNLLRHSEQELDQLKKTLTIHVSQFFRNPSLFDKLQTVVLPYLLQKTDSTQERLRFLSLGCAGGEEPYSLGIILREFFARELRRTRVEIHAIDIDGDILQSAAQAEFSEDRLKELPEPFRGRYFVPNGARMQLTAEIREMVTFHQQNIMDVETFEPCQMVLCRNTLIYFTRPDQEKILRGIAHILPTGGILVLGKSETLVGETRRLFTTICPVERIYRRL